MTRSVPVLVLAALVATGCRIDVTADAAFDVTGGAEVVLAVRIDGATLRELDALGVDPGLVALAELDPARGWRTERTVDADGGLVLAHRRDVPDGPALAAALGALDDGLAADDPALRVDLDVTTSRGGAVALAGTAGLTPPGTTGLAVDGTPVGPSGAALAALTAEAVRPVLRVTVPGPVRRHDGDRLEGRTVSWALPVGDVRSVTLTSGPAGWWRALPWVAATVAGVGAVAGWWRRRGRRSDPGAAVSPAG